MAPFKRYEQLSELVKMYPCLYNKQEKDFKKEVKQRAWKEIAKELDLENGNVVEQLWKSVKSVLTPKRVFLLFVFFPDAFYIDVETKLMMPEAVNDVYLPSLCFHERFFSCKLGDNISLVVMSWR